ncbi:hypothetical protein M422DRAFT_26068 [Sphaerobolus stellatus SS14]|nr:hypothetical protein M422DRAFT_26068 [Sphaerobolus stellatus SS14]
MSTAASTSTPSAMTSSISKPVAASAPASFAPFFRRRPMGRAPSPPMWACYEQIPPQGSDSEYEDTDSDSDTQTGSDSEDDDHVHDHAARPRSDSPAGDIEMDMDIGEPEKMDVEQIQKQDKMCGDKCMDEDQDDECTSPKVRMDKGKQRAIEPEVQTEKEKSPKKRHRRRKYHESSFIYRPILTIKKSEGFVWNQDLFIPSYIKDRYVASTSPPSSDSPNCFTPVPATEFNDTYEVEVVEIRVQGNELEGILSS